VDINSTYGAKTAQRLHEGSGTAAITSPWMDLTDLKTLSVNVTCSSINVTVPPLIYVELDPVYQPWGTETLDHRAMVLVPATAFKSALYHFQDSYTVAAAKARAVVVPQGAPDNLQSVHIMLMATS
jgi:hypothetical protein